MSQDQESKKVPDYKKIISDAIAFIDNRIFKRIGKLKFKDFFVSIRNIDIKKAVVKVKAYDYKALLIGIKNFKYTDPAAYRQLLRDEKFRRRLYYFIAAIIIVMFIKGCVLRPKEKHIPPRPVQTGVTIQRDASIFIESFGTLTAIDNVDIKSQVTGKVLSIHFKEGEEANRGQLLFVIDPSEYKAMLDKAEAALAEDIAQLKLNVDTLNRNKILFEKELISAQEFETYKTEVAAAMAQTELDKAEIELAKINLGYCYITSPIDGLTGKRQVDPGNIITENTGPTLVNIKAIDPFYIDFTISERSLSKIRDAMARARLKVEIYPEEDSNAPYEGELSLIDNAVDDMTGTISLRAVVSNTKRALWAGQFVTLRLILGTQKDAVLAPISSVSIGQKGHYLFVVTDENKADLRIVDIGSRQDENYVVINQGVKQGERVVTAGQLGLAPGVSVVVINESGLAGGNDNKSQKKKNLADKKTRKTPDNVISDFKKSNTNTK